MPERLDKSFSTSIQCGPRKPREQYSTVGGYDIAKYKRELTQSSLNSGEKK